MCAVRSTPPSRLARRLPGAVVLLLLLSLAGPPPARASEPRLEAALERREAVQRRLDGLLARIDALRGEVDDARRQLADLRRRARTHAASARDADALVIAHLRQRYKRGQVDPALLLLTSDSPAQAARRAGLVTLLASRTRAEYEAASAAHTRTDADAALAADVAAALRARLSALDASRQEAAGLLEEVRRQEAAVRAEIAAAQAARERARVRAARAAAPQPVAVGTADEPPPSPTPSAAPASQPAPSAGGIACPVGRPRSYSDTYGAPRSGGRSHMGTDILAPHGTPTYAYEAGTILRMDGSSLGGISLYLRGAGGTVYYYTHLSGYASSAGVGKRVAAGELVAYVGDTGNAAGIPHLHFEVMPGGGGNVNPYPYVQRACG